MEMQQSNATVTQDTKNLGLLLWVATIFFGIIPGLLFYLVKKDDPYLLDQAKESLNWSITALIGWAIGVVLTFIVIGIVVLFLLAIAHLVFCVMGAIAASKGEAFRVPWAIRLVK
jgi:uncharacterized protein